MAGSLALSMWLSKSDPVKFVRRRCPSLAAPDAQKKETYPISIDPSHIWMQVSLLSSRRAYLLVFQGRRCDMGLDAHFAM